MPQVGMQLAAFVLLFPCGVPICPLGSKTEMDSSSRLAPPGDNHFLIFTISHKHIVMLYIHTYTLDYIYIYCNCYILC